MPMTPQEYCKQKLVSSGSSFYYSFMLLPEPQRLAMTALYAFCREVDDVVDETTDSALARNQLNEWREEVGRCFEGRARHPVGQALQPLLDSYGLKKQYFLELIDGMEMDLNKQRYADFEALSLYCYRAASVVGLLSVSIFGYRDEATLQYAHDLGLAFQLTNILRDVGEDAERGRIYLPQNELAQFGLSDEDILQGTGNPEALRKLFEHQALRAESYYQKAFAALPEVDRYPQLSGIVMAELYYAILTQIIREDFPVLKRRVRLPTWKKLLLVGKAVAREKKRLRKWQRQHPPLNEPE